MISEYFVYTITIILLILAGLKTWLFFISTSNRRLQNWFFFSNYALYNSRNERSRKLKMVQNKLSLFILALAILDLVIMVLFHGA